MIRDLTPSQLNALRWEFSFWARPKQVAPGFDWATWLLIAGRGFGKTWTGMKWAHERAMEWPGRWVALVARTPADARDFMIEGPGGFLRNVAPWDRPKYEPSKKRLTWGNGSWATIYSDEEPDQLRGFSGDSAWLDEFAKYKNPQDVWDNLAFGMREASNDRPRRLITTTPRPIKILKQLMKAKGTHLTVGTSHENRENLDPKWFQETILDYENTRLGQQEVHARILEDMPGALWTNATLEQNRLPGFNPGELSREAWTESWKLRLQRIVVAMDPAAASKEGAAEHGIIVAAIDRAKKGYVLEDLSQRCTPDKAARIMVDAYDRWSADAAIAEVNNGGEWIGTTVRQTAAAMKAEGKRESDFVNYRTVHASRGKATRAEPVSTLDAQKRVHHVGVFPDLEDQMTSWDPLGGGKSPDRMDARVWALTELMIGNNKGRAGTLF